MLINIVSLSTNVLIARITLKENSVKVSKWVAIGIMFALMAKQNVF